MCWQRAKAFWKQTSKNFCEKRTICDFSLCPSIIDCVDRGSISLLFFFAAVAHPSLPDFCYSFSASVTELLLFGSAISTRGAGVTLGRSLGDPAQQWEREKRSNSPIVRVPYHKPLIRIGDREREEKNRHKSSIKKRPVKNPQIQQKLFFSSSSSARREKNVFWTVKTWAD